MGFIMTFSYMDRMYFDYISPSTFLSLPTLFDTPSLLFIASFMLLCLFISLVSSGSLQGHGEGLIYRTTGALLVSAPLKKIPLSPTRNHFLSIGPSVRQIRTSMSGH